MHPADIEPSLRTGEPAPERLDDGFSPPAAMRASTPGQPGKPEPPLPEREDQEPNPTRLPVEPEFGPMLPPAEPDEAAVKPPHL